MKDFLTNLEKAAIELPFIQTAISEILNTDCAVDQLALCRELRFTTNNELKVTYTLDQVLIYLISWIKKLCVLFLPFFVFFRWF